MTKSRGILAPRKTWTDAELELLRREFPITSTPELALRLGCKPYIVSRQAAKMGLHKTPEHRARMVRQVVGNLVEGGKRFRFQPGAIPWTKGKPYFPGGRAVDTQFKPGRPAHESHNYVPIGTEKVRDGYLVRKVTDDPTLYPAERWCFVHRLVWVAANGPVPPGHRVVFKPGRRSTDRDQITLDALELITRRELMRRNSLHTIMPPELTELVQLRGAITRQINKRTKAREEQD